MNKNFGSAFLKKTNNKNIFYAPHQPDVKMTDVISLRLGTFKLARNRTQLDAQHNRREQGSVTYIQLQKAFKVMLIVKNNTKTTLNNIDYEHGYWILGELRTCLLTATFIPSTTAFLLL